MTRREVDAVMAHELGHLKGSHHSLLGVGLFVAMAAAFLVFGSIPPGFYLATPLLGAAFVVLRTWISRRLEYRADRAAAKILSDPEAVISSLAKLARLNNMPLNWGAIEGKLLTHPSLIERAESIARAAGVPLERARQIVTHPNIGEDSGHYPLPEVLAQYEGVFSDAVRGWVAVVIVWSRRLAVVAVPMALARLVLPENPWIESWSIFGRIAFRALLCLPLFLAVWLVVDSFLLRAPYVFLRRRYGQAGDAAFVGYAPGSTTRVFGSYDFWDLGFLKITADRLIVAGDRRRFALRREWVQKVRVGRGLPGLFPYRRVFLSWRGEDGAERVLNLRSCEGWSALRDNAWSKRLAAEIERWRAGAGAYPACTPEQAALEAPRLDDVHGAPIQGVVRWPSVFSELTMVWLMAAAINFIALDSFVLLADLYPPLLLLLQRLPALLAKE